MQLGMLGLGRMGSSMVRRLMKAGHECVVYDVQPEPGKAEGPLDCSATGRCLYAAHGRRIAIVTAESGLPVLCYTVDAIVAQVPAGFRCRSIMPVVDRIDSWRRGAVALWLDNGGITVESANESRGDRPWVPHPRPKREQAPPVPKSAD